MITLQPITETNFLTAAALSVSPDQGRYVAPAPIILARAYAYRRHRASAWGVYDGCRMVGLALMEDLDEEPACYHLSELLIDEKEQGAPPDPMPPGREVPEGGGLCQKERRGSYPRL